MTEYELIDVITSLTSSATPVLVVFMTLVFGYVGAAWLVGAELNRSQVTIVSTLYLIFASFLVYAWVIRYQLAIGFVQELQALNPDRQTMLNPRTIYSVVFVLTIILIASLKFMWDVRRSSNAP